MFQKPAVAYGGDLPNKDNSPTTLSQALWRAALQDQQKGILYIQSDGSEIHQPYATLYAESNSILLGLRQLGLHPGDKVILQVEGNRDYLTTFWACVLGGFIAIPIPIAKDYQSQNTTTTLLKQVWEMCAHPVVVASPSLVSALQEFAVRFKLEYFRTEVVTDLSLSSPEEKYQYQYDCQPDDIVTIIFTSGSTNIPKGVAHTHKDALIYIKGFSNFFDLSSKDVTFHWLPLLHAMGLFICHLRDVYLGCFQIHAEPQLILKDPLSWIDFFDRYRVTCSMAPNFAFSLIADSAKTVTQKSWDLSALRCLVIGGELIVPETVQTFLDFLRPYKLSPSVMHPHYGMTEALGITIAPDFTVHMVDENTRFVEVGVPLPEVWLRIVDEHNQILAEGNSGRVQVKGPCVISGYYLDSTINQEAFIQDGWLDTGDVGLLHEGRLSIVGRNKDIIIINGRNYSCQGVEAVAEEVSNVEVSYTAACAIRTEKSNTDLLAIFYSTLLTEESDLLVQAQEIQRRVVSKIGINPTYLIIVDKHSIPKTPLGKIQRAKLKKQFEAGVFNNTMHHAINPHTVEENGVDTSKSQILYDRDAFKKNTAYISPRTPAEQHLAEVWAKVFSQEKVGINDNFFALGGDSLLVMRVITQASNYGISLKPEQIFQYQTIAELAPMINTETLVQYQSDTALELGDVPLTSGQAWQLSETHNPHYFSNEGFLLEMQFPLELPLLRKAVKHLIVYHDALRLRFRKEDDGWKQFLTPLSEELPITWINLADETELQQQSAMELWMGRLQASVNLCNGPIMQVAYFDRGMQRPDCILWIFNHTIADYFSIGILLDDFQTIYQQLARDELMRLPPKTTSFKQWSEQLRTFIHSSAEMQRASEEYWPSLAQKVAPLPVDFPARRAHAKFTARLSYDSWLDVNETDKLLRKVYSTNSQLIDVLLLALVQTITSWTGYSWLHVGVTDHGRKPLFEGVDLSRTVGYISYVQNLFLEFRQTSTSLDRLSSIKEQVASIPYKGIGYNISYYLGNPRGQAQPLPLPEISINNLSYWHQFNRKDGLFSAFSHDIGIRTDSEQVDNYPLITVTSFFTDGKTRISFDYNKELYRSETIENIAQSCLENLREFIE